MCLCGVVVACGTRNTAVWGSLLARAITARQICAVKMCKLTVALTSLCINSGSEATLKGVSHVAGDPYLLNVKEPVHVTENNVMYSHKDLDNRWTVGQSHMY